MKKYFFAFALGFVVSAPFALLAQNTFPLPDLVKLTSKNGSDFETAMLEKDYSVQSKLSNPTTKVYTSDQADAKGKKYSISRHQVPGANPDIVFTTTDKKYYIEVKTKLASGGYKFVKEENKPLEDETPVIWYHYTNGIYKVRICTYTTDAAWFKVQIFL